MERKITMVISAIGVLCSVITIIGHIMTGRYLNLIGDLALLIICAICYCAAKEEL